MPFAQNRLLAAAVLIRREDRSPPAAGRLCRCAPQDDGAGYGRPDVVGAGLRPAPTESRTNSKVTANSTANSRRDAGATNVNCATRVILLARLRWGGLLFFF